MYFCKELISDNNYVITPCSHFIHTNCIIKLILENKEKYEDYLTNKDKIVNTIDLSCEQKTEKIEETEESIEEDDCDNEEDEDSEYDDNSDEEDCIHCKNLFLV